jgi:hypothetical protein
VLSLQPCALTVGQRSALLKGVAAGQIWAAITRGVAGHLQQAAARVSRHRVVGAGEAKADGARPDAAGVRLGGACMVAQRAG